MKDMQPQSSIPWKYFSEIPKENRWNFEKSAGNAKRGIAGYALEDEISTGEEVVRTNANIWTQEGVEGRIGYAVFDQTVTDSDGDTSGIEIQIDNDGGDGEPLESLSFELSVLSNIPKEGEDPSSAAKIVIRIEGRRSQPEGVESEEEDGVEIAEEDGEDVTRSDEEVIAALLVRIGFTDPDNQEIDFEATLKALIDGVTPKEPEDEDEELVVPNLLDLIRVQPRRGREIPTSRVVSSLEEGFRFMPRNINPHLN